MSGMIAWIAASAEKRTVPPGEEIRWRRREKRREQEYADEILLPGLPVHQFPAVNSLPAKNAGDGQPEVGAELDPEHERERRMYRGRTVAMLRRYMRYSLETGRMPSLLGREFFRATVTKYRVTTFEDRVIFVHDMEICLERLDEFSRQLIARHILQEHDQAATSRLLQCSERTVRTYVPVVLDLLAEILLEVGLLDKRISTGKNSCQEGESGRIAASDWEDGK